MWVNGMAFADDLKFWTRSERSVQKMHAMIIIFEAFDSLMMGRPVSECMPWIWAGQREAVAEDCQWSGRVVHATLFLICYDATV